MEIFYILIFGLIIYFGIFKKYYNQEKNKFLVEKRDIERVYSSFLSDVFVDKNDNYINVKNIENIEHDIIYFMKRIEKIQKIFLYLQDKSNDFEKKDFIIPQIKWILDFSIDFVKSLDDWLEFHKSELLNLVNNLQKQSDKTKIENFKGNLLLHKKLIEEQAERISVRK